MGTATEQKWFYSTQGKISEALRAKYEDYTCLRQDILSDVVYEVYQCYYDYNGDSGTEIIVAKIQRQSYSEPSLSFFKSTQEL